MVQGFGWADCVSALIAFNESVHKNAAALNVERTRIMSAYESKADIIYKV